MAASAVPASSPSPGASPSRARLRPAAPAAPPSLKSLNGALGFAREPPRGASAAGLTSRTSCARSSTSKTRVPVNRWLASSAAVFSICSTHGEKEQKRPPGLSTAAAFSTASHGDGRSKMHTSTKPGTTGLKLQPGSHTSPCVHVTRLAPKPLAANSHAAYSQRCSLNSNVYRWPDGATVVTSEVEREPEPVPASMTVEPGTMSRRAMIVEMSAAYRICVRCERLSDQSSGVGASTCTNPLPLDDTALCPNGRPISSSCRNDP
mmetsp:Transcript_27227/g.68721  ORF Transcript_27227/g.68721 Transcript_27227/m.68721 type:complete len:263 (+) Transcript_27227:286-1074(+)